MKLDVQGICWSPDKIRRILDSIELHARPGDLVGIIGPNASGKSSLLRCIYRALRPDAGSVLLDGKNVREMKPYEAASKMALVLQETSTEFEFTVLEIVLMGRHPHKQAMEGFTAEDIAVAHEALHAVGMMEMQTRPFTSLSDGEKQLTLLARALAQKARLLVLDEPTNHLDVRYALEILAIVKKLRVTTLAVLHDLNLAAAYCDRLYVLHKGRVRAHGPAEEVLTSQLLAEVFEVGAVVEPHPITGRPSIVFFPLHPEHEEGI
jgi:iron complex transport system ATP-binding protein